LRRLIKDYQPDYIGIVFDPPGATFRDNFSKIQSAAAAMLMKCACSFPLFAGCAKRCACHSRNQRLRSGRCDWTMAVKAGKHNLEVLIVSNDKDMMQLVGKNVRTLRTGREPQGDIIVDEKKVEELLGVLPEKVVDYMALLGDTIDNIPEQKESAKKAQRN